MIKRKYGNEYGFQTRAVHTGNQLSHTLHLSARNSAKTYPTPTGAGQQCFCAVCCWSDYSR